ncbi:MAG: GNAT family N-acetyltransferase [Rhodoglobus sp.]
MAHFTIDELNIPATLDDAGAADFVRMIEVVGEVDELSYGNRELYYEPAEELPDYNDRFYPYRVFLARVDGVIVGRGLYKADLDENNDSAWASVSVLPDHRHRGIGAALADRVEQVAREYSKSKLLAYLGVQPAAGDQLPSPTGFGSVPADNRDVKFLLTRGYTFEQVERLSRLPLPIDNLDELVDAAASASGPEYALHTWVGSTPERWLEDVAVLITRMSTDAPSAGLEQPEVVFTVERVLALDERDAASPRTRLVTGVEHVPSGTLVGFTVLSVPSQLDRNVDQYATLVLHEHRGHRLGMLLKVANLQHLERIAPGHPAVVTFNAEENRHMLSVNEAVGFVPIGMEACWRLNL